MATVTIELKDLSKSINKYLSSLLDDLESVLHDIGIHLKTDIRTQVPKINRFTGKYENSIDYKVDSTIVSVFSNLDYASKLELGTNKPKWKYFIYNNEITEFGRWALRTGSFFYRGGRFYNVAGKEVRGAWSYGKSFTPYHIFSKGYDSFINSGQLYILLKDWMIRNWPRAKV